MSGENNISVRCIYKSTASGGIGGVGKQQSGRAPLKRVPRPLTEMGVKRNHDI